MQFISPLFILGVIYICVASAYFIFNVRYINIVDICLSIKYILIKNYKLLIIFAVFLLPTIAYVDLPITKLCKYFYSPIIYNIFDNISRIGEGWFLGGILLTMGLACIIFNQKKLSEIFCSSFMALIFAGISNGLLKFIFNRERPSMGNNQWHFFYFFISKIKDPSNLLYAYNSMPSGHVITTVASLTVLYCYTSNSLIKTLLIGCMFLMICARIYTINHWLSDTIVSAVLGVIIGVAFAKNSPKKFNINSAY